MKSDLNLVSIIVPVYNISDYLERCIKSIIRQTYSNIEIILVNDGSTDDSDKICDDYARADKRVKVIHQGNKGLSGARNTGILNSGGEYLCFIDGDDFVSRNYVEILLRACLETGSEVSCCGYLKFYGNSDEDQVAVAQAGDSVAVLTVSQAINDMFSSKPTVGVTAWNKMYKRNLFEDHEISFPEGRLHEDNFTTYKVILHANRVAVTTACLYYYVQRTGSIMNSNFNKHRLGVLDMFSEAHLYFAKNNTNYDYALDSTKFLVCLNLYNDYLLSGSSNPSVGMKLAKLTKEQKYSIFNKLISRKHKLMYILILMAPKTYVRMRNFSDRTKV